MAMQINPSLSMLTANSSVSHRIATGIPQISPKCKPSLGLELGKRRAGIFSVRCSEKAAQTTLRTCKNCKTQFDPLLNHPRACRYHTAHFGGTFFNSLFLHGCTNHFADICICVYGVQKIDFCACFGKHALSLRILVIFR